MRKHDVSDSVADGSQDDNVGASLDSVMLSKLCGIQHTLLHLTKGLT